MQLETTRDVAGDGLSVVVLAEHFTDAIHTVARFVPKRHTLPILENVLIGAKAGRVTVTASDLVCVVTAYVEAQVETEGECLIPARRASKMLRSLKKAERIQITGTPGGATLDVDGREIKLQAESPGEYPPTAGAFQEHGTVTAGDLRDALHRVLPCLAALDERPVLTCVYIEAGAGKLTVTGADGFSLGSWRIPYEGQDIGGMLVKPSTVFALSRLLPKDDTQVGIDLHEQGTQARFMFGYYEVSGLLDQGSYPNYAQLIPDVGPHTVEVARTPLMAEIDAAESVAHEGSGIIRLIAGPDSLTIRAQGEEVGTFEAEIPAKVNEAGKTAMFGRALAGLLRCLHAELVTLSWESPAAPMRITEDGADGVYVRMPMLVRYHHGDSAP